MTSVWNGHEAPPWPASAEVETPEPTLGQESPFLAAGTASEYLAHAEAAGPSTPPSVQEVLELQRARESLEWGAVRRAVAAGNKDPGRLTNLVFLARHPERGVRALSPSEPCYAALVAEREMIRDTIVRPMLAQNHAPALSAETWVQQTERPTNGRDLDGSTWLETDTVGVEDLTGQDPEYVETTAIVRPWNGGARVPTTSVAAWAALARALQHASDEAGPGLEEAARTPGFVLAEQSAGEVPYPAGDTALSVESVMIKTEIEKGVTNENVLTDLVFHRRYPARKGRPLSPNEPSYSTLSQEWLRIRDTQVRPMLTPQSPPAGSPYVPAPPASAAGRAALPLPRAVIGVLSKLQAKHHDYPAIDIGVPVGTPVYAVVGGTVERAGPAGGFGSHAVYVRDDTGNLWIYGHGSAHRVTLGQRVPAGHHIADGGNEGVSSGPHLHLEIKDTSGNKRCPQPFLTAVWNGQVPPPVGNLPTTGCSN